MLVLSIELETTFPASLIGLSVVTKGKRILMFTLYVTRFSS